MKIQPDPVMNQLPSHVPGVKVMCVVGGHAVNDCAHILVTFPVGLGGATLEHGGSETESNGTRTAILLVRDRNGEVAAAFTARAQCAREDTILSYGPPYIRAHHRMAEAVWVEDPCSSWVRAGYSAELEELP